MNVIDAAQDTKVKKVIALSTDKAYQPVSAYGQSKALMESLFLSANNQVRKNIKFSVTRYGNVAGSRGSIIPVWYDILKESDTVPVTSPECTRFWMTINQAVDLVTKTIKTMPTEIVIPNLPAYRVGDLAEAMDAEMYIKGLPVWEKLHEGMDCDNTSDIARRMSVKEIRQHLEDLNLR
jgi:UDP-N-acetylglucosamine 4,6-dehydratase